MRHTPGKVPSGLPCPGGVPPPCIVLPRLDFSTGALDYGVSLTLRLANDGTVALSGPSAPIFFFLGGIPTANAEGARTDAAKAELHSENVSTTTPWLSRLRHSAEDPTLRKDLQPYPQHPPEAA